VLERDAKEVLQTNGSLSMAQCHDTTGAPTVAADDDANGAPTTTPPCAAPARVLDLGMKNHLDISDYVSLRR
jgi:hypothetical protein